MFEKIRDNISLITIFIIVIGYYDIYTYYQKFGISIYNYLEPTEIIFAFSSIFHTSIELLTSILTAVIIVMVTSNNKASEINNLSVDEFQLQLQRQLVNSCIMMGILAIVFALLLFITLLGSDLTKTEAELVMLYSSSCINFYFLIKILIIRKRIKWIGDEVVKEVDKRIIEKNYYRVAWCFVFLVVTFYFNHRNSIKYRNVRSGNPKYSVQLSPAPIDFTENSYYIGSTKSYIFFYDNALKKIKAYPERNIQSISIKELREGL